MSNDKYPPESGRRRFVKGVVGGSTLAAVGAGGAVVTNNATKASGRGGGAVRYAGARNVDGPAPRAIPQIPIELDDEGYLKGVWPTPESVVEDGVERTVVETELGGMSYGKEWFQYCGVQDYPGLAPTADRDNYLRYARAPATYEWQSEQSVDGKIHLDDLAGYESWGNGIGDGGLGKPARATWRSQELPEGKRDLVLPVLVLRSERIERLASDDEWLAASTVEGTVAFLDKCTHYCCVPGYKETEGSAKFDAENKVYCACHQSVYDPFQVVERAGTAFPRTVE